MLQPKDYFQLVSLISKTACKHVKHNVRVWGDAVQNAVDPPGGGMNLGVNGSIDTDDQRPILLIMGGSHLVKHSIKLDVVGKKPDAELQRELDCINITLGILDGLKKGANLGPEAQTISVKWLGMEPNKEGVVDEETKLAAIGTKESELRKSKRNIETAIDGMFTAGWDQLPYCEAFMEGLLESLSEEANKEDVASHFKNADEIVEQATKLQVTFLAV